MGRGPAGAIFIAHQTTSDLSNNQCPARYGLLSTRLPDGLLIFSLPPKAGRWCRGHVLVQSAGATGDRMPGTGDGFRACVGLK